MKTHTRRLRSLNFGSAAHRRRVGEHQAGAARLGGASHALKTASCTLALVLALYSSLVHPQVPTCAAPGCNSVTSDPFPFLNTAIGTGTLVNLIMAPDGSTGAGNTAAGYFALNSNTTGVNNTAVGMNALYSNNGDFNTASGMNALYLNSTGIRNTATGYNALYDNTYGTDNTASGFQALNRNSGGHHNTADGLNAVFHNTTGNDNTGVGYLALFSNTTGLNNIAL